MFYLSNASTRYIILHLEDHVATALEPIEPCVLQISSGKFQGKLPIVEPIETLHKFSLTTIAAGQEVFKYGVPIGVAYEDIAAGTHVHLHNLRSNQWKGEHHEGIQESGWKNRNT